MFDGFADHEVQTGRGRVFARVGGEGPPLLLLHGYPQTHLMWHSTAPLLTGRHTVVVADLPGYGASFRPDPTPDDTAHSKRALAVDLVEAMAVLGHDRFAVAGHDRGGRVAYRMALDHPDRVRAAAVLDVVQEALFEPAGDQALWRSVPSWFVFGELDHNIPAGAHRIMAERAGARRAVEIRGASHVVGISHPDEVASLVRDALADRAAVAS